MLGKAGVDSVVTTRVDIARRHAVEELLVGDRTGLEQVQVVCPGGQVVHVPKLVEEEPQEVELDGIDDLLAVPTERLGHDPA